jgi:hypothetical protein
MNYPANRTVTATGKAQSPTVRIPVFALRDAGFVPGDVILFGKPSTGKIVAMHPEHVAIEELL